MDEEITTSLELTEVVSLSNLSSSLPHHLAKIKLQCCPFLLGIPLRKDPSNRFSADSWAIGVKLSFYSRVGSTDHQSAIAGRKKGGQLHVIRKVVTSRKRLKIGEMTWFRKRLFTWHCVSTCHPKSCLVLVQNIPSKSSKAASVFASSLVMTMMDGEIISHEIHLEKLQKGVFLILFKLCCAHSLLKNETAIDMERTVRAQQLPRVSPCLTLSEWHLQACCFLAPSRKKGRPSKE